MPLPCLRELRFTGALLADSPPRDPQKATYKEWDAFHYAKPIAHGSVGIPDENRTTFSN